MKRFALAGIVMALAAFAIARAQAPPAAAAAPSSIEPLQFHHVHLNSVNPAAAADYYPKPFALSAFPSLLFCTMTWTLTNATFAPAGNAAAGAGAAGAAAAGLGAGLAIGGKMS